MTLPSSGPISIQQINAEFGRGLNLGAYRGTPWFTDDGASGAFPGGAISFSDFYGKRLTAPHHPFGFNNFSGVPTLSDGDLTASGSGVALTSYAVRGGGYWVEFQINSAACIVGICQGTPSSYPGDSSQRGFGLRQDGTLFEHFATDLVTSEGASGYGDGSIVGVFYDGSNVNFYINGSGVIGKAFGGGASFYPCVQVGGGSVTLRTSGAFNPGASYWYP